MCVCMRLCALGRSPASQTESSLLTFLIPRGQLGLLFPKDKTIAFHAGYTLLPCYWIFSYSLCLTFFWVLEAVSFVLILSFQAFILLDNILKVHPGGSVRFLPSFLHLPKRQCDAMFPIGPVTNDYRLSGLERHEFVISTVTEARHPMGLGLKSSLLGFKETQVALHFQAPSAKL